MAAKGESSTSPMPKDVPHREEFADFALVLKDGQELKCHKVTLAKVSPFFCTMLRQDCVETETNKMKVTEFESETVESFLDYIYGDLELDPVQATYKRNFDNRRLTADLLRMSHMYQVKNLEADCIQYLTKKTNGYNAVDVWAAAERIGNDDLKKVALDCIAIFPKHLILKIPGLKESFQSPRLVESLVTHLARDEATIRGNVQCFDEDRLVFTARILVKLSYKVKILRLLITDVLMDKGCICRKGSLRQPGSDTCLNELRTIKSYNLLDAETDDETTLVCDVHYI